MIKCFSSCTHARRLTCYIPAYRSHSFLMIARFKWVQRQHATKMQSFHDHAFLCIAIVSCITQFSNQPIDLHIQRSIRLFIKTSAYMMPMSHRRIVIWSHIRTRHDRRNVSKHKASPVSENLCICISPYYHHHCQLPHVPVIKLI